MDWLRFTSLSLWLTAGLALVPVVEGGEISADPVAAARGQLSGLALAVAAFQRDMGRLPTPTEGLAVLVTAPTGADAGGWRGPYLDPAEVPRDPWGSAYVYDLRPDDPERPFTIHSRGPDGVSATAGTDADDVGLWAAPSSPGQDPGGAVLTGVVPKLLRGPFVLVVVLLVAVAWLRIYAGRAARQPELHAGGYVRRHLRRQRRRMAAGGSTSDTD